MSGMLHILGARLATEIEKDENVCRGMLRIAIADNVERLQKTMDHRTWMEHLNGMSFRDWEAILQGGGLSQRFRRLRQVPTLLLEEDLDQFFRLFFSHYLFLTLLLQ